MISADQRETPAIPSLLPPIVSGDSPSQMDMDTTSRKRKPEGFLYETTVQRKRGSQIQLLDLPIDILCSIVSLLPIRDAIRTSILSSQWRYIWCHHTNLTFNCFTLKMKRGRNNTSPSVNITTGELEFIATLDGVLNQHCGTRVDLMEIRCALHNKHASHIDRWVKFAIVSKTKDLALHLAEEGKAYFSRNMPYGLPAHKPQPYIFPCHLFAASASSEGSYLQRLQLTSISLKLPVDFNGFPNLKRLSMVDVDVTNEDAEYLLSKCNLLEFLEIACCRMLTTLRTLCRLNRLRHLKVQDNIFVQQIDMNCRLTTLDYSGPMVPLQSAASSSLRNVRISFTSDTSPLDYITTGFPSALQHLETLNLRCNKHDRASSPVRLHKFMYLRHLRVDLNISGNNEGRKTDVLDYAYLLDCAPSLEELELHMWMECHHKPYRTEHGELRSFPRHQHTHLKSVYITGFFGHKDQLELALHILLRSAVLKTMKIDSRVKIMPGYYSPPAIYRTRHYLDGYGVATALAQAADRNDVVEVSGAIKVGFTCFTWEPEL